MKSREVEMLITYYRWPLVMGLIVCAANHWFPGLGVFSACTAVILGASGGSLRAWRSEPGLWKLSLLFLLIFAQVWALVLLASVLGAMRRGGVPPVSDLLDLSVGTMLLGLLVRLLATVTIANWKLSRKWRSHPPAEATR